MPRHDADEMEFEDACGFEEVGIRSRSAVAKHVLNA